MIPSDRDELSRLLLKPAGTDWAVEAAILLIIRSTGLLDLLVERGHVTEASQGFEGLAIDFSGAVDDAYANSGSFVRAFTDDDRQVLAIAASLVGERPVRLRECLALSPRAMKTVAEAIMYAGGYLDGYAEPQLLDSGGHVIQGPGALAHQERIGDV